MGPTPAKVGMIMTGIHRQPVLIPGPFYMSPVRTLNNCHRALHWDGPGISKILKAQGRTYLAAGISLDVTCDLKG